MKNINTKTAAIYTLGCKVNQYESEAIAEALEENGIKILSPSEICDAYIINACTVTAESDRKARQFIRRAISKNPNAYIAVTGCFAQTSHEEIAKINGVDLICGNTDKLEVAKYIIDFFNSSIKKSNPTVLVKDIQNAQFEDMSIHKFERTRAYVKIEDGCENRCAYCIIPSARGKVRSKDPNKLIAEVEALVKNGCILVAEGANMPTTAEAFEYLKENGVVVAPLHLDPEKAKRHNGKVKVRTADNGGSYAYFAVAVKQRQGKKQSADKLAAHVTRYLILARAQWAAQYYARSVKQVGIAELAAKLLVNAHRAAHKRRRTAHHNVFAAKKAYRKQKSERASAFAARKRRRRRDGAHISAPNGDGTAVPLPPYAQSFKTVKRCKHVIAIRHTRYNTFPLAHRRAKQKAVSHAFRRGSGNTSLCLIGKYPYSHLFSHFSIRASIA